MLKFDPKTEALRAVQTALLYVKAADDRCFEAGVTTLMAIAEDLDVARKSLEHLQNLLLDRKE